MKISVIMPSYLGVYQDAATNREYKFERAVNSFLQQTKQDKELVIVSDGCSITNNLVNKKYPHDCINHISIFKQMTFSGNVREMGLRNSCGEIVCYLDSDDFLSKTNHLDIICNAFEDDIEWVYFNDIMQWNPHVSSEREAVLERGRIGTSNIAHRNLNEISWSGMDGYGHDWSFIMKLMNQYKSKKISGTSYTVCHIPNVVDF